jgi:hypothetical protein
MGKIIQATSIRHEPIHRNFGCNYQSDFRGTFDEVITRFRMLIKTIQPPVSWAYLIDCSDGRIIAEYLEANKDHEEVFIVSQSNKP